MAEREIPGGVARGDCHQVIEEMERLSVAQQNRLILVCATNPHARRKGVWRYAGKQRADPRCDRSCAGR